MACCVTIAPKREIHDHYFMGFDDTSDITFIELHKEELIHYRFQEIYLFATWCPACIAHLKALPDLNNAQKNNTLYISTNYDTKNIVRFAKDKIDTVFILSNAYYGTIEREKIEKFTSELLKYNDNITGLPQRFAKNSDSTFTQKPVR